MARGPVRRRPLDAVTVERERNRAVRIAYTHARAGDSTACARWLDLAGTFTPPTPRQMEHARRLLAAAGPHIHAGQLAIDTAADAELAAV